MNTILITGSNGFIGSNLLNYFRNKKAFKVIGLDIQGSENIIDVSNQSQFQNFLSDTKPNVILHCAAMKNLEECEKNKEKAFKINVLSTETIKDYYIKHHDCHIIYISSDVVFDGEKGNYKINDLPIPINWYGKTKVFSEIILRKIHKSTIFRTALVIGKLNSTYRRILKAELENDILRNQTLLPHYIYQRLKQKKHVKLPKDFISNPTPVDLISIATEKVIRQKIFGLFHLAGSTAISRYDFAKIISKKLHLNNELIKVDKKMISKVRPKNISLDVTESFNKIGLNLKNWNINEYINTLGIN